MKAIVKTGFGEGKINLIEWDEPQMMPDEVIVRVEWAGICGSDIGIFYERVQHMSPVVLGHEFSGEVIEIGKKVKGIKKGDKVVSEPSIGTCGVCEHCQVGNYNVCPQRLGLGRTSHGAFRKLINLNYRLLHKIPLGITTKEAALCEPSACCYHAVVNRGQVKKDEIVFIFGPGAIGITVAQIAKAFGANVFVVGLEQDKNRLELCREFGCNIIVLSNKTNYKELIEKTNDKSGADLIVECSGSASASRIALDILKPRGRYVQVGLFGKEITNLLDKITVKEIKLLGSYSAVSKDFDAVLKLLEEGKIKFSKLISKDFSLDNWKKAFTEAQDNKSLKVLFKL